MAQRKTVSEYEALIPSVYEVVVQSHAKEGRPICRYLGTRSRDGVYLKPKYTPNGEVRPYKERIYSTPPDWLNYPVDTATFPPDRNTVQLIIRQEDLPK